MEQVHIGRRYHPHVRLLDLRGTDADEFAALEHAEQPSLGSERKLTDFVQEEGSPVIFLEIPFPGLDGAGEGSFLVAEELRVRSPFGDGPAVDGEVLVVPAAAVLVDNLGNILLSDSALPRDQHSQVRGRYGHGHLQRPVQGGVVADDVVFVLKSL